MAIPIEFTQEELDRNILLPVSWYRIRVDKIEQALSKAGDSTNYPVTGTIIKNADDGTTTFAGREFGGIPQWFFNSKGKGFMEGFFHALGIATLETGKRYDLEAAVGKELDVFIIQDTYQGRVSNKANNQYRAPRD